MYIHDLPAGTPAANWVVPVDNVTQNYKALFSAVFPQLETITDINTAYDAARPVRFIGAGSGVSNAPASSAILMGIEINYSANYRLQIVGRANSSSWPVYTRHYNSTNGWSDWKQFTMVS